MPYRSKNFSYYQLRAADCLNAADNIATTPAERAILLHCAARWQAQARHHEKLPSSKKEKRRDTGRRAPRGSGEVA